MSYDAEYEERELTRTEKILALAMVILLFFGTVESLHVIGEELFWSMSWSQRRFWSRVLLYGVSVPTALISIFISSKLKGFKKIYGSVFIGYGMLLLIWSVGTFLLDCLPEVTVSFAGAAASGVGLWYLRKKYYTPERIAISRLRRGLCPSCGKARIENSIYCPVCGFKIRTKCENCGGLITVYDRYCPHCGSKV